MVRFNERLPLLGQRMGVGRYTCGLSALSLSADVLQGDCTGFRSSIHGAGRYGKCFLPASVFLLYSDESDENTYLFCREILFHKRLADEWKQSPYFGQCHFDSKDDVNIYDSPPFLLCTLSWNAFVGKESRLPSRIGFAEITSRQCESRAYGLLEHFCAEKC